LADLVIGYPVGDPGAPPRANSGQTYVVFGKTSGSAINVSTIAAGSGGFVINGEAASDGSGYSVTSAGDMNGDGINDILIGAYKATANSQATAGKAYVVYGRADLASIDLSTIALGSGGFVIAGLSAGGQFGQSVSAAGDINGDGFSDLLVGAPMQTGPQGSNSGNTYVILGGEHIMTTANYVGGSTDDTLTGSSVSETFVAGAGNDTVTGNGGADVMYGGAGNDVFVLNADNIAKLSAGVTDGKLARIDGGTGLDTLQVMGGASLDLTAITNVGGAHPMVQAALAASKKLILPPTRQPTR